MSVENVILTNNLNGTIACVVSGRRTAMQVTCQIIMLCGRSMGHVWDVTHAMTPGESVCYHLPYHLHSNTSTTNYTTNGAICGKYKIISKYNNFHRPYETVLFVLVKACLCINFLFNRTFENFIPLIYANKHLKDR